MPMLHISQLGFRQLERQKSLRFAQNVGILLYQAVAHWMFFKRHCCLWGLFAATGKMHLPVAPAPAPVAPGGVVDLDSDEGDSDHHDEDHEDLSDGEGGEQELDAMEGAVIAAAEGGSRDALKAAIAQLKANFRKMRVNRN